MAQHQNSSTPPSTYRRVLVVLRGAVAKVVPQTKHGGLVAAKDVSSSRARADPALLGHRDYRDRRNAGHYRASGIGRRIDADDLTCVGRLHAVGSRPGIDPAGIAQRRFFQLQSSTRLNQLDTLAFQSFHLVSVLDGLI